MLNIMRIIHALICVCATLGAFSSSLCYATSETIAIQCSESAETASWHNYEGEKGTQYSLTTQGIKVAGIPNLVLYWTNDMRNLSHYDDIHVDAKCTSPEGHEYWVSMWGPGKTCPCKKGESLSIIMLHPNDPDPNKYLYVATLTTTHDD
ncbi:MAG: hypothetical protein ACD_21C00202G0008 [uncultured bacterium]|nr:MAG: hypothetical protein ACD_21C00202G0008 [uncultured bacterium]